MAAAAGVVAAVCSGLANGSWNLPTKPDAPKSVYAGGGLGLGEHQRDGRAPPGNARRTTRASSRRETEPSASRYPEEKSDVRSPPQVTQVANVMIPVFNTVFVLAVEAAARASLAAEPAQMAAIIVGSMVWGFGGVGFGQSIKRLGVALGTQHRHGHHRRHRHGPPRHHGRPETLPTTRSRRRLAMPAFAWASRDWLVLGASGILRRPQFSKTSENKNAGGRETAGRGASSGELAVDMRVLPAMGLRRGWPSPGHQEIPAPARRHERTISGVQMVCLIGGVFSSMLQFAFVFGGGIVGRGARGRPDAAAGIADLAVMPDSSDAPSGTAATRRDCSSSTARGVGSERRRKGASRKRSWSPSTPRACAR